MEPSTGNDSPRLRLLGLGNELLADDAFGILVAREVERQIPGQVEVVCSSASGLNLLDHLVGASRLIVVDTIVTGAARPGEIHVFHADPVSAPAGVAPHSLGLFQVLALAREWRLHAPEKAVVIAVEASDCTTVGGEMHPDVRSAIAHAVDLVRTMIAPGFQTSASEFPSL